MRAALDHFSPEPLSVGAGRLWRTTRLLIDGLVLREPVVGPFPDISGHIEEAVAVARIGLHRRGALVAVEQ